MKGRSYGRLISSIVVMSLILTAFSFIASNNVTADQQGDYSYTVSNGMATVTGFLGGGATTIPSTLGVAPTVAIGGFAFDGSSVTSVTIPDSVKMISANAFSDCSSLTAFDVSPGNQNYSSINGVLYQKTPFTLVRCPGGFSGVLNIPNGVTSIGEDALSFCTGLTGVTIPNSVTSVGDSAFQECTSLVSVTMSNNVTMLGSYAFDSCSELTSQVIPNSVTSIGNWTFHGCASLKNLTIPENVTYIGPMAFLMCTSVTSIEANSTNPKFTSVDGVLYDKSLTNLVQYPEGRAGAVVLPTSVTSIGSYAFADNQFLTSVTMGSAVAVLGTYAFQSCTSLTNVTVPESMATIGYGAFSLCSSLTSMTFLGPVAPTSVAGVWIDGTPAGIVGHAYAASNFPVPGSAFHGLMMGPVIPVTNVRPGSPRALSAEGHNGYVVLTWEAPATTSSPAIVNYGIWRGDGSDPPTLLTNVTSDKMSYNDTSVTDGHTYVYVVDAVNAIGSGPASNSATATPSRIGTVPGAPTGLTASSLPGKVGLSWTAPVDPGSGIINYLVHRGTVAAGEGTVAIATIVGTSYQDLSVDPGTRYFYIIKANGTYGTGLPSAEVNATAINPTTPSAPQNLTCVSSEGQNTLVWAAPTDDGGAIIVSYDVYRSSGGSNYSQIGTVSASALSYVDDNATAGIDYAYYVVPVNSMGAGAHSAILDASERGVGSSADNSLLYLGIGAVVVAMIGIGAFMFFRGRKI